MQIITPAFRGHCIGDDTVQCCVAPQTSSSQPSNGYQNIEQQQGDDHRDPRNKGYSSSTQDTPDRTQGVVVPVENSSNNGGSGSVVVPTIPSGVDPNAGLVKSSDPGAVVVPTYPRS